MDILVLIKQVPATETPIEAIESQDWNTKGIRWIINPCDEIAVEEAVRIREAWGGSVTVFSFGTDHVDESLTKALAIGADEAVLIRDDPEGMYRDGLTTATVISRAIRRYPYDIIIAGHRAIDDDGHFVGPATAEILKIPCVSGVIRQEVKPGGICCQRIIKGGTQWVEVPMPMLFTAYSGLNTPRYASLPSLRRARKKNIQRLTIKDLGIDPQWLDDLPVKRICMVRQLNTRPMQMMEGETPVQKVNQLVAKLREDAGVI